MRLFLFPVLVFYFLQCSKNPPKLPTFFDYVTNDFSDVVFIVQSP